MNARETFTSASGFPILSAKDRVIEQVRALRLAKSISVLEAATLIAKFAHHGEPRKSGGTYFDGHIIPVMYPEKIFPELGIELTDFERALAAVHDIPEKKFDCPQDNISCDDITHATLCPELGRSAEILCKKEGQPYFEYDLNVCKDGQISEMKVKTVDNYSNLTSNPSAHKKKIYEICIPYRLARLAGAIPENYDHAIFAAEKGLYDHHLFLKEGPQSAVVVSRPANDYSFK